MPLRREGRELAGILWRLWRPGQRWSSRTEQKGPQGVSHQGGSQQGGSQQDVTPRKEEIQPKQGWSGVGQVVGRLARDAAPVVGRAAVDVTKTLAEAAVTLAPLLTQAGKDLVDVTKRSLRSESGHQDQLTEGVLKAASHKSVPGPGLKDLKEMSGGVPQEGKPLLAAKNKVEEIRLKTLSRTVAEQEVIKAKDKIPVAKDDTVDQAEQESSQVDLELKQSRQDLELQALPNTKQEERQSRLQLDSFKDASDKQALEHKRDKGSVSGTSKSEDLNELEESWQNRELKESTRKSLTETINRDKPDDETKK